MHEFNKVLDDLENIDIKMEEEDKALIILSALPKSFENFKDTILLGRQSSITPEEVQELNLHPDSENPETIP
ncbi:hypothetical protein ACS0TY_013303 [Phlomoides rotata]